MIRSPLTRKTPMNRGKPAAVVLERVRAPLKLVDKPVDKKPPTVNVARKHVEPKLADRKSQKIRDSAKGEECLVRIPGCPADPSMTVWSHAPLGAAGKGGALKSLDLCGAYCCTYCDAVIDGQRPPPAGYTRPMAMLDWFVGHMRSLVRLRQKGLV